MIKRDDKHRAYSYKIISSPLPVAAYQSTISVMDGKDGGSELKWTGKYIGKGPNSADAKKTIDGIYRPAPTSSSSRKAAAQARASRLAIAKP